MVVDPTLLETAQRLKRVTTNRDVLALCEAVMSWKGVVPTEPVSTPSEKRPRSVAGAEGCAECERRRSQRTAAQKRWRDGKRQG